MLNAQRGHAGLLTLSRITEVEKKEFTDNDWRCIERSGLING